MRGLFDDEVFPSKSMEKRVKALRATRSTKRVVQSPDLPPGRYRLSIVTDTRPYASAITVDVLRVYDDNTVDIKVVSARYLQKGAESNVPLSWDGGRRVFTEVV